MKLLKTSRDVDFDKLYEALGFERCRDKTLLMKLVIELDGDKPVVISETFHYEQGHE